MELDCTQIEMDDFRTLLVWWKLEQSVGLQLTLFWHNKLHKTTKFDSKMQLNTFFGSYNVSVTGHLELARTRSVFFVTSSETKLELSRWKETKQMHPTPTKHNY